MEFEFLSGNLALDFTNTVHDRGAADPSDDLKTSADLVAWATQAGVLRARKARQAKKAGDLEAWFRRSLALRELFYEVFIRAAQGKRPTREAMEALQGLYRNAARHTEFQVEADHYRLTWPGTSP